MSKFLFSVVAFFIVMSCSQEKEFPCMGIAQKGQQCYSVAHFEGSDQKGNRFTSQDLLGKPYLVEFFYVSCPSICPIVKSHLVKLYNDDDFVEIDFVSFTLAPEFDSPKILNQYASDLGVNDGSWTFVNVPFKEVYPLANSYLVAALPERTADGEIEHDGRIVLIDAQGHIRATCKATEAENVAKFKDDVKTFLAQQ
jgi:protein SCO1/2